MLGPMLSAPSHQSFGGTILVDSSFDSNSSYQAKAVGVFTATVPLYLLQLHLEHQQQLVTSFICDNEGLVKCIIKYYDNDTTLHQMQLKRISSYPQLTFPKHSRSTTKSGIMGM